LLLYGLVSFQRASVVDDASVRGQVRGAAAARRPILPARVRAYELFFETIVMNSPPVSAGANSDLKFERWDRGHAHPAIRTTVDVAAMRRSVALFASSSTRTSDAEVLDRIDQQRLADA
jgi:hypothetical protein